MTKSTYQNKELFEAIKAGLEEALAHSRGEPNECTVRVSGRITKSKLGPKWPEEKCENPIKLSKEKIIK